MEGRPKTDRNHGKGDPPRLARTGGQRGAQREIETLALLAEVLPDSYSVDHTWHWTDVGSGQEFSNCGEINFVVVNRICSKGLRG